jgi:hypothetical protein
MPPRLDMTPYWLIAPVAMGALVLIVIVLAVTIASRRRQEDDQGNPMDEAVERSGDDHKG